MTVLVARMPSSVSKRRRSRDPQPRRSHCGSGGRALPIGARVCRSRSRFTTTARGASSSRPSSPRLGPFPHRLSLRVRPPLPRTARQVRSLLFGSTLSSALGVVLLLRASRAPEKPPTYRQPEVAVGRGRRYRAI
jgi:hypothetical protein